MGMVASAGDVNGDGYGDLIIGMPLYGKNNSGAVLIYYGSQLGILSNIKAKIEGKKQEEEYFGGSVSGAGDINGDGYGDIIIGSSGLDIAYNYSDEGAAYIHYGSANGINFLPSTILQGNASELFLGGSVKGIGDLNGDGFGDVSISKKVFGDEVKDVCAIYCGSSLGLTNLPVLTLEGSVDGVGDLNGDGLNDIGQSNSGLLYIHYGSLNSIGSKSVMIESSNEFASFGSSISGAGDVNSDGYSDIVVGVLGYSNGQGNEGATFVYFGSMSGINSYYSFKVEGNQESAFLGNSVSGAGDINGDGYSDLILGAHQHDNGQTNEGMVYVYNGNAGNKNLQNNLRLYNSNLTSPISQTQKAKNNFGAGLFAKSFLGTSKGALVWETKAKGQGFSKGANNSITNSTQSTGKSLFANLGATGTELKSLISKQGSSTKVRVRVRYAPTTALTGQMYGPWRYLPAYLLGNSIAPAPEDVVDDMSETVKRKVEVTEAGNASASLYVYPNPASDRVMLKSDRFDQIKSVQMLTVEGKLVYRSLLPVSEIDARSLAAGNYILLVTHNDGSTSTRKVVIKK
jgi:hypothetical protein